MNNDDLLYKSAYDSLTNAQKTKNQADVDNARKAINSLNGTAGAFGIGEFSKQLDTVQQGITSAAKPVTMQAQQPQYTANAVNRTSSSGGNVNNLINKQYEQALAARTAAIQKARDTALSGYNQQIKGADGQYQPYRNEASFKGAQNIQNIREQMARQGLFNSGDNVSAQTTANAGTQNSINSLNTQQQNYVDRLRESITQAQTNAEYDIASAVAEIEAQKAASLINQYNLDRNFNYQSGRDSVADSRYNQEFDYKKYLDSVSQSNWQSQFDYGKQKDGQLFDYQKLQDALKQYQWEQQFNYGKERDTIGDNRSQTEFDYTKSLNDREYQLKLQELAAARAKASSGSSSSATKAQTDSDKKSIWNEFYGMTNPTDRERWLNSYRTQIINALGADEYKKLYNEVGAGVGYNYSTPAYLH